MARSMTCPIARFAETRPEAVAIIDQEGGVQSYRDLDRRVREIQRLLMDSGLSPEECVAWRLGPSVDYVAALFATFRSRLVSAPLSTRLPKTEVDRRVSEIGSSILIDDASWFLEAPTDLRSKAPAKWQLDEPATIIFTSGSSGEASAAVLSLGNHVASAEGSVTNIPLAQGDRWLLSLPMYHVGGLAVLVRAFLAGATVVLDGGDTRETINRHQVSHASFVPTQLHRLIEDGVECPPSLRYVLLGGSSIPLSLIDSAIKGGWPILTSYGMTEAASQIATTRPGADRAELLSAGYVLPGREVRIDEDGRIYLRGAVRFLGYLKQGELERPFDEQGWYGTGDAGEFDREGRLVVRGRIDEVFISGGENIHPSEVERALTSLEGISEAVVVPVEDEEFGHRPFAFIGSDDEHVPIDRIRGCLQELLPGFMIPVGFARLPDMPGRLKPRRAELRRLAQTGWT
jgi:o-succinylbenzoate---CoA ligase